MKKILSLILVVITVLSFGACGYKPESGSDTGNDGTGTTSVAQNTPKTVMDMFDGERKVWFLIDSHYIAHDSIVHAVFVTENKQVTEGYFISSDYYKDSFRMSDLDKLSDDEIISSVSKKYKDISKSYTLDPSWNGDDGIFEANSLPINIRYNGALDQSGNKFSSEDIMLLEKLNYYPESAFFALPSIYTYKSTILPVTIKSKDFVGLNLEIGTGDFSLITQNTFDNFGELELDSPEGATALE